jgi:hypothetical protein
VTPEAPAWPIPLKNNSQGDLAVVKFFEDQPKLAVRPVDRMLAFWSHLVTRKEGAQNTIDHIIGGHKQAIRVFEKMWMLQATFFTMKWGLFTMSTGRQEVNDLLKRQQEEVKQAHD